MILPSIRTVTGVIALLLPLACGCRTWSWTITETESPKYVADVDAQWHTGQMTPELKRQIDARKTPYEDTPESQPAEEELPLRETWPATTNLDRQQLTVDTFPGPPHRFDEVQPRNDRPAFDRPQFDQPAYDQPAYDQPVDQWNPPTGLPAPQPTTFRQMPSEPRQFVDSIAPMMQAEETNPGRPAYLQVSYESVAAVPDVRPLPAATQNALVTPAEPNVQATREAVDIERVAGDGKNSTEASSHSRTFELYGVELKGLIYADNGESIAMLRTVGDGSVVARKGDFVPLITGNWVSGQTLSNKSAFVTHVTNKTVHLRLLPTNEEIVLR